MNKSSLGALGHQDVIIDRLARWARAAGGRMNLLHPLEVPAPIEGGLQGIANQTALNHAALAHRHAVLEGIDLRPASRAASSIVVSFGFRTLPFALCPSIRKCRPFGQGRGWESSRRMWRNDCRLRGIGDCHGALLDILRARNGRDILRP